MTSDAAEKYFEQERTEADRYLSKKKTTIDLLFDYEEERERIKRERESWSVQELMDNTREFQDKKKVLMDSLEIIRELKNEGLASAEAFLTDNRDEVTIKEIAASMKKPLEDEMSSFRKKTYDYLKRLQNRIDKIGTPAKKEDFDNILAQFRLMISQIPQGGIPAGPPPAVDMSRADALQKARQQFDKGDRAGSTRTLLRGGFQPMQIEGIFEDWARTPARPTGATAGPSLEELRKMMREEMQATAGPSLEELRKMMRKEMQGIVTARPMEEYEPEWIEDPNNPDCWDRYTLGKGMKEIAAKKISATRGIPLSEVEEMIADRRISNSELADVMDEITPEEVKSMLINTNKVRIIQRSPEYEVRLMSLPFSWGNGIYFTLSPEGRRKSGWSLWERLDTICKVVEENMRTGSWTYQSLREAGISRSWVHSCIREVRKESK
jgi:hypothetical protein